jgi:hypothetical protein
LVFGGIVLPIEGNVDAPVREIFEGTGPIIAVDDLTLLSGKSVHVAAFSANNMQHI